MLFGVRAIFLFPRLFSPLRFIMSSPLPFARQSQMSADELAKETQGMLEASRRMIAEMEDLAEKAHLEEALKEMEAFARDTAEKVQRMTTKDERSEAQKMQPEK